MKKNILYILLITSTITACKTVDIRTDYSLNNNNKAAEQKGRDLLKSTYEKMGYAALENTQRYEVNSLFRWKMPWTIMPMNALPGNKGNEVKFKNATNTFDGNVTFLEGRKKDKIYGIQSWETYQTDKEGETKQINNKRYNWGLATYHYVIEAPMRLLNAEIVRYAGEKEWNGKQYDLVYATWGKDEPHKEHDQWLVYINKQTGMTDMTEITINDFFLPMPPGMKGATIQTERKQTSIGAYLPSLVTIQLGTPKKQSKHVYTFDLHDYQFDSFATNQLYPLKGVEKIGDAKKTDEL